MRRILDLSLFQEVWYTGEQELLVTSRVAEQNLSIKVHSFKLQLDYGA
jgi:hypothetical protein